jgi:hypothetical protein
MRSLRASLRRRKVLPIVVKCCVLLLASGSVFACATIYLSNLYFSLVLRDCFGSCMGI